MFVSVSPDGRWLCFRARPREGAPLQLFVRGVDRFELKPLPGTERATSRCFWSPDNQSVLFYNGTHFRLVDTVSGAARDVVETTDVGSAAINRDGIILLGSGLGGLRRIDREGAARVITTLDESRHELVHDTPVFLPDGNRFLYLSFARDPSLREQLPPLLYAGALDSGESRLIGPISSRVEYVEPGYLLFVRDGTLMYVRFDAASLTIRGEPGRVADGVSYFKPTGNGEFSASLTGVVTYRPPTGGQTLTWLDRSGLPLGTLGSPGAFSTLRFSPDGSELLADVLDLKIGTPDLWMFGTRRPTTTRLTFGPGYESNPVMTPDGKWLFYSGDRLGVPDVFVKQLGSAEEDKPFWVSPGQQYAFDVSPDGRVIVLGSLGDESGTGADLYTAPTDGSAPPAPFVRTPFNEANGRFSPDGRTIAYHSNESGTFQVYTKPFPGPGPARQVSTSGGTTPRWSPDGRQLYFRRQTSVFVVDVSAADAEPRLLFDTGRAFGTYEIAPDGQRFLMSMIDDTADQVPTRILVNWPAMIDATR